MDIEHVHVRRHQLFDLVAPEVGVTGPVRAAFDRLPRTGELTTCRGKPMENAYANQVVGVVEGWARSEQSTDGLGREREISNTQNSDYGDQRPGKGCSRPKTTPLRQHFHGR